MGRRKRRKFTEEFKTEQTVEERLICDEVEPGP
jgi:hypothetical protein